MRSVSSPVTVYTAPVPRVVVRLDVTEVIIPFGRLLGEHTRASTPAGVLRFLGRLPSRKVIGLLDEHWDRLALRGALLCYRWTSRHDPTYSVMFPNPTDPRHPDAVHEVTCEDPLLTMNLLTRLRHGLVLPGTRPDLRTSAFDACWVCDDPRIVELTCRQPTPPPRRFGR